MKITLKSKPQDLIIAFTLTSAPLSKDYKSCLDKQNIVISASALNLSAPLYGSNKKQSKQLQKDNSKKIIKVFNKAIKVVKTKKKMDPNFDGTIYFELPQNKQNNNEKILEYMLNVALLPPLKRLGGAVDYACTYLDNENATHNMCDFKNNRCAKHRARGFCRDTGCCPSTCKFSGCGPCKTQNLSCKIIMCDHLENQGYYFSVHHLPILRHYLTYVERLAALGLFFKSKKQTHQILWLVRILTIIGLSACILAIIALIV